MNVTLKQADRLVSAFQVRMQANGWGKPVVTQEAAMLEALKQVFGEEVTDGSQTIPSQHD